VVWELVFMMVILKIPILYLCAVVWWAIKAEPRPLEGAALPVADAPEPWPGGRRRRRTPGPRRGRERRLVPPRRAATASARVRR
jgi:hypothetical protein